VLALVPPCSESSAWRARVASGDDCQSARHATNAGGFIRRLIGECSVGNAPAVHCSDSHALNAADCRINCAMDDAHSMPLGFMSQRLQSASAPASVKTGCGPPLWPTPSASLTRSMGVEASPVTSVAMPSCLHISTATLSHPHRSRMLYSPKHWALKN